jgi:hypothetical protein
MSETIKISDDLTYYHREDYPSYPHVIENTFINGDEVTLTDAEFDALAMHSPLVKRIVDALSGLFPFAYARVDECSMDNADNDPDITKAKTVLAEIAALTEGHAEEKK